MRNKDLLIELAGANTYTAVRLPTIERLNRSSIATSLSHQDEARKSLVLQRTGSVYWKDPLKQKRNLMRGKKEKAALADTSNWKYTTAERYAVLDQQIRGGGPPGLAQAILVFDLSDPLDVNSAYVADKDGNAICTGKENGWLELVAKRNGSEDVAYIRLLSAFGASQASKDRALAIVLERAALDLAQELLRNDADPNALRVPEYFITAIRDQNKVLYTMFLRATTPLEPYWIDQALLPAVGRDSDLVALLLAHGGDGMNEDGEALCAAIKMRSLQDTAIILVNADDETSPTFLTSLDRAIREVCDIAEEDMKLKFFKLLLSAGADADTSVMRDELLKAVKNYHHSLIKLFIDWGTSPDRNDAESLRLAVTSGQIDVVEIILQGNVSQESTSRALDEADLLENVDIYEEIVRALVERGVSKPSLSRCLHESVQKGATSLAALLIEKGATLDYGNASSIRKALNENDFALFGTLLEGPCDPGVLCGVLPDAMKIQPSSERFDIMTRLLQKGVSGRELHIALQTITNGAKDQTDYALMEILIKHSASADFFDSNGNCMCIAAAHSDGRALDLLCQQGDPNSDTVSAAMSYLPVSFATAEAAEYELQVGFISTLLEKGARGNPTSEMLIKAVRDDHRQKVLKLLVQHGADANYGHGKAIKEALALTGISALEMICKGCKISNSTFVAQFPNFLRVDGFSLKKLALLARTSESYGYEGVLNVPLLDEVRTNGARTEVIQLLLKCGASADFQHGGALYHAVKTGNIEVCRLILSAGVKPVNIALSFPLTSKIIDRSRRYTLMGSLLEAARSDVGQDEALVQAAREAIGYDLSFVELLLHHHASPNFHEGAAVIVSVQTKNLALLKRFTLCDLDDTTLDVSFRLIRELECTQDERYNMFETILELYSDKKEISRALIEAVTRDVHDIKTATLLLDHDASLEASRGHAARAVAFAGSIDLLKLMLSKSPSQQCRDASFDAATNSLMGNELRLPVYRCLLDTGISQDLISAALLAALKMDTMDHSIVNLLLDFNASLDYDDGMAMNKVVVANDLKTLNVLLRGNILRKETLDRSFSASMTLGAPADRLAIAKRLLEKEPGVSRDTISRFLGQIIKEGDHDLLDLVMEYKPDPAFNGGESLVLCAQAGDAKAADLLSRVKISSQTVDQAFEQLLDRRSIQSRPDGLETAKILLKMGVSQHLVDRALLDGFHDSISRLTTELAELLVPYKPNVNGGDGKIFVDMAENRAEIDLFMYLASQKPDLNIVIPALIRSLKDEGELITWLDVLEQCAQREGKPLQHFLIFQALNYFPDGHLLVKYLLAHGCPANSKIYTSIFHSTEAETLSLLIWALSRVELPISEEVIMEILNDSYDPEVSLTTGVLRMSAAILASMAGKNTVLKRLLEIGIDLSHRDRDGYSALFYASRNGHLETAKILIEAGIASDDGSLHEAAREAHPQIIELLLQNGHRADYPSNIHADGQYGRTALEELCLNTRSGSKDWSEGIRLTIKQLLRPMVKDIPQSGGKTMLHLAIENTDSVAIIRELLSFSTIWENINDPVYLYQDDQGLVYSLTKYAELLYASSDPEKCKGLVKLLRASKCKDRFYAHTVIQPPGAIGLPDEVADAVNKQKRIDHEQREELKRLDTIAALQRAIESEEYNRNQEISKKKHRLLMKQLEEQETTEKQIAQNKQDLALKHTQQLQRERQEAIAADNRARLKAVNDEATRRAEIARSEQAAELNHKSALTSNELSLMRSRRDIERQILADRESASLSEYKRQVDLCNTKDASARYQASQRAQYSNV